MKNEVAKYVAMLQQAQKLEDQQSKLTKAMEKTREGLVKKLEKKAGDTEVGGVFGGLHYAVEEAYPEFGNSDWKQHITDLTKLVKSFDKDMAAAVKADAKAKADEKKRVAEEKARAKAEAKEREQRDRAAADKAMSQPHAGHDDEDEQEEDNDEDAA